MLRMESLEKGDSMKYIERQYAKYEQRYCEKHGRLKFLRKTQNYYKNYILLVILDFITAFIYSVNGIVALTVRAGYIQFPNYIWYFSLSFLWLLQAVFWAVQLPFYKKKSLECKLELETDYAGQVEGDLTDKTKQDKKNNNII